MLAAFDLGRVGSIRPYRRGRPEAPKAVIETGRGKLLLKRRPPRAGDTGKVTAAHQLIRALAEGGLPVPAPLQASDGTTWHTRNGFAYELFPFVEGRDDNSEIGDARASGALLASFAEQSAGLDIPGLTERGSYVDADYVRANITSASERLGDDFGLGEAYENANTRAQDAGIMNSELTPVHGDWHPGNLIYHATLSSRVVGLVDFDTARLGRVIEDAAVGALQAALRPRGGPLRARDGSFRIDPDRFLGFCAGVRSAGGRLSDLEAVPPLVGATLIAEAVGPVASHSQLGPNEMRTTSSGGPITGGKTWLGTLAASVQPIVTQATRLLARLDR